ncbi:MAG: hypothetical protein KC621_30080, partial [Myxococcales bacterium]|nr:hypothetical protein [Myxococcales bacterium]
CAIAMVRKEPAHPGVAGTDGSMMLLALSALAAPPSDATCDTLSLALARIELPDRPEGGPDFWWMDPNPCGQYGQLAGIAPPEGEDVWCEERKKKNGRRTRFTADGKVTLETRFLNDEEVGPRVGWDPMSRRVVSLTPLRKGQPHGRSVVWTPEGTLATTWVKGVKQGFSWTLDERGRITAVESWVDGVRSGRSCAWRDGVLQVDHLVIPTP